MHEHRRLQLVEKILLCVRIGLTGKSENGDKQNKGDVDHPELDDEGAARVEDGAAINFLTEDDPPVFGIYKRENRPPTDEDDPNFGIHHPRFGFDLKTKMDALGIECIIHNNPRMADDPAARTVAHTLAADFLAKELKPEDD